MTNKQYENIGRLAEQWLICMDGLVRIDDNLWECQKLLGKFPQDTKSKKDVWCLAEPFATAHAPGDFFEILRVIISTENMKEIMKEKTK